MTINKREKKIQNSDSEFKRLREKFFSKLSP